MKPHTVIYATFTLLSLADAAKKQCTTAKNNLMRCFVASTELASSYCSTYLTDAMPMVTVTATLTATTSVPTFVATEVDVLTLTSISASFSTTTVTSVQTTFITTTITAVAIEGPSGKLRRKENVARDQDVNGIFHCVVKNSRKAELYAASSISSACLCLAPPQTQTTTVIAATQTDFIAETTTTSTTTVVQVVTVLPQTAVETVVETDVITTILFPSYTPPSSPSPSPSSSASISSSATPDSPSFTSSSPAASSSTVAPPTLPPSCDGPGSTFTSSATGLLWIQIFAGSGVSENPNNPSNQATPDVTTLPGTLSACEAVNACANYVFATANNDYSFDLHWLIAEQTWSCTGYFNAISSAADWNVADSNIGVSYGYAY